MCRLMCYAGEPVLLADVVTWPKRSIIKQSYDARERLLDPSLPSHLGHGNINADGFGIGWYATEEIFDDTHAISEVRARVYAPLFLSHPDSLPPSHPSLSPSLPLSLSPSLSLSLWQVGAGEKTTDFKALFKTLP